MFYFIYSLNIPHSNQNPYFFPVEVSVSSFQNSHFGYISPYRSDRSHTKIILIFLFVILPFSQETQIKTTWFVYLLQAPNLNSTEQLRFTILLWESQ